MLCELDFSFCYYLQRNARVATYTKALQKIRDANGEASEATAGNAGGPAAPKVKKHCKDFPVEFSKDPRPVLFPVASI